MKFTRYILTAVALTGLAAGVLSARADDSEAGMEFRIPRDATIQFFRLLKP
jgi:hypothetical protein